MLYEVITIPQGLAKIEMAPISTGLGEIFQYTLELQDGYKDNRITSYNVCYTKLLRQ